MCPRPHCWGRGSGKIAPNPPAISAMIYRAYTTCCHMLSFCDSEYRPQSQASQLCDIASLASVSPSTWDATHNMLHRAQA